MAMMKVKKDDGMSLVGKIITIIFIVLLAAAIYYFVTLFKGVEITPVNLAGEWKQAGNPTWFISFTADGNPEEGYDGTAHSYYQSATGEINRYKGLPIILESFVDGHVSDLVVVTNKVCYNFQTNQVRELKHGYKGVLYSWTVSRTNYDNWLKSL